MNLRVRHTVTPRVVLTFIVGPAIFVVFGVWLIVAGGAGVPNLILGWACILFFGGGAAAALTVNFVFRREPLVLDQNGISGVGPGERWCVPWSQVDAVYAATQWTRRTAVHYIAVGVVDEQNRAQESRIARINSKLVGVPVNAASRLIPWNPGVKPSIDVVLAAVAARGVPVYDNR